MYPGANQLKLEEKAGKSICRYFGTIWFDEEAEFGDVIFISVTHKGKLLINMKVGGRTESSWMYFDYQRTVELVNILSEGLPVLENVGREWRFLGSLMYDMSDWIGGPFDDHRGELLVGARDGAMRLVVRGHPKNDGEDWTVSIDSRVALQMHLSLKKAEPYLKEVQGQSDTEFEPKGMLGRYVQYEVDALETPQCPRFPPARITKIIQGQYPQPNYVIEFAEPVTWKRKKGYDVRFLGMKCAVLMSRYGRGFELLLEKDRRRKSTDAYLHKLKAGVNPYEIRIARVGIELESTPCWGGVRLVKPGKKLFKKLEKNRVGEDG
ncbi:MAG: hypothetical protein E3J35_08980 [Methanomassiliicoccales archaeon]|nr:MAG: hypothetical protein E3J35_08980 [Methanomassiliicoccales archaeon]